jgi:hypothetical protein
MGIDYVTGLRYVQYHFKKRLYDMKTKNLR